MNNFKFNSLEELYRKLMPALNTKVADLKRHNIKYISESDIWHYLRDCYWQRNRELSLGEIVNDILATPNSDLEAYMAKKINQGPSNQKEQTQSNELL